MTWTLKKLVRMFILIFRTFGQVGSDRREKSILPVKGPSDREGKEGSSLSKRKPLSLLDLSEPGMRRSVLSKVQHRLRTRSDEVPAVSAHAREEQSYHSVLPGATLQVLSASPWMRTSAGVQEACKALQICKAFCDYPPHIQRILCQIGWYQRVEKGRVIVREGHPASGFYFTLSGSVGVYKDPGGKDSELINTVEEGQAFGEYALMNDSKRTTTCIAVDCVELFAIGKSDYIDLSLRQVKLSYQRAMYLEFCRNIAILRAFPLQYLQDQPDICQLTYFKPGSVIVKDSTKNDWIFIVINGSCQVLKKFVKSVASSEGKQYGLQRTASIYGQSQTKRLQGVSKTDKVKTKDLSEKASKKLLVQLQRLHSRDVFGLSSLVYAEEPSVTLISNGAELIQISKQFIQSYIDGNTLAMLRKQVCKYPSQSMMEKRIREHHSWSVYKETLVNRLKRH